jgi:hypothetical protein
MTAEEFVSCIRREILEENLALYRQYLEHPSLSASARDTYWPRMTELYQSLNEDQRRLFIDGIRQVMVDTLSNVFGILDGSTVLKEHREYFHLTYSSEPQELNGDLQDLFLSSET